MFRRKNRATSPAGTDRATAPTAPAGPAYHSGTLLHPDEGAAHRVDSAADIDPNVRQYGEDGVFRGGAGGYGGAGTK
jgi:hypothetical protein